LIARDASFKRALDQNPAATQLFAAMVKAEVEGHGRVYQFEVPDFSAISARKNICRSVPAHCDLVCIGAEK
jgi:hypothetical protein